MISEFSDNGIICQHMDSDAVSDVNHAAMKIVHSIWLEGTEISLSD